MKRKSPFMLMRKHERTLFEKIADWCTAVFGTTAFLFLHILAFSFWVFTNAGVVSFLPVVDPYPFNFLTTIVSLEAIFLSIVVLMSQNRAARLANVRDELDFEVNVQSEREITKMLQILTKIEKRLHVVEKGDPELKEMLRTMDIQELERRIIRAIEK